MVPVIHWLDINEDAGQRPDWTAWKTADIELWKDQPRLVLVTKPPSRGAWKPSEYFSYCWTNQTYVDVATARANMDHTVCATIFASTG